MLVYTNFIKPVLWCIFKFWTKLICPTSKLWTMLSYKSWVISLSTLKKYNRYQPSLPCFAIHSINRWKTRPIRNPQYIFGNMCNLPKEEGKTSAKRSTSFLYLHYFPLSLKKQLFLHFFLHSKRFKTSYF